MFKGLIRLGLEALGGLAWGFKVLSRGQRGPQETLQAKTPRGLVGEQGGDLGGSRRHLNGPCSPSNVVCDSLYVVPEGLREPSL